MSKVGNILRGLKGTVKGLVREGLQTLPVVGTIVTNFKTDTPSNPKGKIKLEAWDYYRLAIGIGVAVVLYKGLLNMEQIQFVLGLMGM